MTSLTRGGIRWQLPRFTVDGFSEAVKKGFKEQGRVEDEERKAREARAAMWTTRGLRPLAEPPTCNWHLILERDFSEPKLNALFDGIPEKQTRAKDLMGEIIALREYGIWLNEKLTPDVSGICSDDPRAIFYQDLQHDVIQDSLTVHTEWTDLYDTATALGSWEFMHLDADGKTTGIQRRLKMGKDILSNDGVRAKYGHLAPTGYDATPLAMFECNWLDENGGTQQLKQSLRRGYFTLENEAEKVRAKYGHLSPTGYDATPLGIFEYIWLDEGGGTKKMEQALESGLSMIEFAAEDVRTKYAYLQPKHQGRDPDNGSESGSARS